MVSVKLLRPVPNQFQLSLLSEHQCQTQIIFVKYIWGHFCEWGWPLMRFLKSKPWYINSATLPFCSHCHAISKKVFKIAVAPFLPVLVKLVKNSRFYNVNLAQNLKTWWPWGLAPVGAYGEGDRVPQLLLRDGVQDSSDPPPLGEVHLVTGGV